MSDFILQYSTYCFPEAVTQHVCLQIDVENIESKIIPKSSLQLKHVETYLEKLVKSPIGYHLGMSQPIIQSVIFFVFCQALSSSSGPRRLHSHVAVGQKKGTRKNPIGKRKNEPKTAVPRCTRVSFWAIPMWLLDIWCFRLSLCLCILHGEGAATLRETLESLDWGGVS